MTSFGAIRWDAFSGAGPIARGTANALSPSQYQSRAPFWANVRATNLIEWNYTQEAMDAEIEAAVAGGLSYWAFAGASTSNEELQSSFSLYQTSAMKAQMPWCMMRASNEWGSSGDYAEEVAAALAHVQQPHYFKVLTNRPLVYVFYRGDSDITTFWGGSTANFKAALDAFRAAAQTAGLGNPYIVIMEPTGTIRTDLGADAVCDYAYAPQIALEQPYATLAAAVEARWASLVSTYTKIVPCAQLGWDPRPRIERVPSYLTASYRPRFGVRRYTQAPTPAEVVAHVQAALNYVAANPSACDADTVIAYAWNEFDEGGWLCPTLGDPTGARLTALSAILA